MRHALALALLLAGCASGPALLPVAPRIVDGVLIDYAPSPDAGRSYAVVAPDGASCVVYLDVADLTPEVALWILEHETAHCTSARPADHSRAEAHRAELAADCAALRALPPTLRATALGIITAWLQDRTGGERHPIGAERAALALECAP